MAEKDGFRLHNFTEDLVYKAIDELLKERHDVCHCPRCRTDMAAIALNKLRPQYVVTRRGEVFTRLGEIDQHMLCEVMVKVHGAIEKVKNNPRHEGLSTG